MTTTHDAGWIHEIEWMLDDATQQQHPSDSPQTFRLSPSPNHIQQTPPHDVYASAKTEMPKPRLSQDSPTFLLYSLDTDSLDSPDTTFELPPSPEMNTLKTPLDEPPRLALPPLAADAAWAQPRAPSSALSDTASDDTLPIEALTEAETAR